MDMSTYGVPVVFVLMEYIIGWQCTVQPYKSDHIIQAVNPNENFRILTTVSSVDSIACGKYFKFY